MCARQPAAGVAGQTTLPLYEPLPARPPPARVPVDVRHTNRTHRLPPRPAGPLPARLLWMLLLALGCTAAGSAWCAGGGGAAACVALCDSPDSTRLKSTGLLGRRVHGRRLVSETVTRPGVEHKTHGLRLCLLCGRGLRPRSLLMYITTPDMWVRPAHPPARAAPRSSGMQASRENISLHELIPGRRQKSRISTVRHGLTACTPNGVASRMSAQSKAGCRTFRTVPESSEVRPGYCQ